MNRTQIIGNLGADAEVRHTESGQAAISFSVGVTERWTDKQGAKQERTDWFRCTYWKPSDKTAIAQYLKKGTKVLLEGKASARAWINQSTGEAASSLELNVQNIELLSPVQQAQPQAAPAAAPAPQPMAHTPQFHPGYQPPAQPSGMMSTSERIAQANASAMPQNPDEDLPF